MRRLATKRTPSRCGMATVRCDCWTPIPSGALSSSSESNQAPSSEIIQTGTRRSRSHAGCSGGCGDRFPSLTRFRPFEDWLLIDPKPLAGEPAFDTGHFLRTVAPEGLDRTAVDQLVDRLAAELDLDAERVSAWALVRSVDDVLWGLETYGSDVDWDLECARVLARSL